MNGSWKFFLMLTIACLMVQGFYAMLEMACVSFNKVRLQYYASKKNPRALWLSYLLSQPAQLFGTTLIGVNAALQLGSECARRFYLSLGLSPDWAPLTQVILVLIFAEISPLFAGRRYAENVAMLGVPVIYASSIVLRPVIWLFDILCKAINRLVGSPGPGGLYLSREEFQKILEEREESRPTKGEGSEFDTVAAHIFSFKNKTAKELMLPLNKVPSIPSTYTIGEMRTLLFSEYSPYLPMFHRSPENVVAIAYPRDLLRYPDNRRVREYARPPWFITEDNSILQILKQFRRNNQSIAVVLNAAGLAIGILTLDQIVDELFEQEDEWDSLGEVAPEMHHVVVDRTLPGETKVSEFNEQFHVQLPHEDDETFEELMTRTLGHHPGKGEVVRIEQFELIVEEASILGAKMISVKTMY